MRPELFFLPDWPPVAGQLLWVAVLLLAAIVAGEAARRWLGVSRILGYVAVGAALGPQASGVVTPETLVELRVLVDIAVGLLLFELGQRVDLGWLRRNPWLLATSVLEAALAFGAVFVLLTLLGARPVAASTAAVLAMLTSPAVVMTVVKDVRAQGQVTERLLLLTALNTAYAVIGFALIAGWVHLERSRDTLAMLAHPFYLVVGSVAAAALVALATRALLRLLGRRPVFQFAILVAIVLLTVAGAAALKLSVPLALLFLGVFGRAFDRARHFVPLRFGETAMLFVVILFAVTGASLQFEGWGLAFATALGFVAARFAGKAVALVALARPSAQSIRSASLLNLGLVPMSGLALLLVQDLVRLDPRLGAEILPGLMFAITLLAFLGPLATEFALRRAGEVAEERAP
jgi:Kef-type K+ transport system membrane component KefB